MTLDIYHWPLSTYVTNANMRFIFNSFTATYLHSCLKNNRKMKIKLFFIFVTKYFLLFSRELTTCRKRFRTSVDNFCVYLYAFFKPSQKHGLQAFICAMLKSSMPNLRSLSESKIMLAHCIRDVISCFSYPLSCISP